MIADQSWINDAWTWLPSLVFLGSLVSGLVVFVIILVLTEPRHE